MRRSRSRLRRAAFRALDKIDTLHFENNMQLLKKLNETVQLTMKFYQNDYYKEVTMKNK